MRIRGEVAWRGCAEGVAGRGASISDQQLTQPRGCTQANLAVSVTTVPLIDKQTAAQRGHLLRSCDEGQTELGRTELGRNLSPAWAPGFCIAGWADQGFPGCTDTKARAGSSRKSGTQGHKGQEPRMGDPEVNITLGAHSDQSESRRFICATVTASPPRSRT